MNVISKWLAALAWLSRPAVASAVLVGMVAVAGSPDRQIFSRSRSALPGHS
jgi:hypothetical protein